MTSGPQWPGDADGDVLRRMRDHGFDFSRTVDIEFIIDFPAWPPSDAVKTRVHGYFGNLRVVGTGGGEGYLLGIIRDRVTYELVLRVQREVGGMVRADGGGCDSWGVLQA